jgi:hypothetical protein
MGSNHLVLPRTDDDGNYYLSYSQYNTWKRSKREYIRQYFFGERFEGNAYTDFGSWIGEALENNDFSDGFTKKEQEFMATVPRFDEFEREIKLQMDGFYVKGFIDTNTKAEDYPEGLHVRRLADYKTGDIAKKTAEYEGDDYCQLELYAAALEQEYGIRPDHAQVVLIGRSGNAFRGEELKLTCEYTTVQKELSDKRMDDVLNNVQQVAEEISAAYQTFLKMTSNEV